MRRPALTLAVAVALTLLATAPLLAGFAGTDVFLPSVGRRPGTAGSQWFTMLWIHNPSSATANVTIYFLERGVPNPAPLHFNDSIPPGDSHRYPDTITTLFNVQKWGALRVTANVPVLATCRMYNLPPGGEDRDTQGQDYAAVPASFAIGAGQSAKLLGVYQSSPQPDSQFRYSFGWVETTGGTADVRVLATDELGNVVGDKTYPTTAGLEARYYPIEDLVPGVNSTHLTLEVRVVAGSGKVAAVGSGVANRSNDGTTFEMSFRPDLLGGGAAGLSAVTHDASLTGDGTVANALGIADAAISKPRLRAGGGTNGQVLATDGTNLLWQNAGVSLPFNGTTASAGPAFSVVNTSGNPAIQGSVPFVPGTARPAILGVAGGASTGAGSYDYPAGVWGDSKGGVGTFGTSDTGPGVYGASGTSMGVFGVSVNNVGVMGVGAKRGVEGATDNGDGVRGNSTTGNGVYGISASGYAGRFDGRVAVAAASAAGTDIFTVGNTGGGRGLTATASTDTALWAVSTNGIGVDARSTTGNGINASSGTGFAGYFFGKVNVTGTLTKGGGAFKIDHPLDPRNKYLYHSFVESPDMKNVYDGVVTTDGDGLAVVQLPEWFEALNRDFRYQLTVIGRFAQAIVEREVENNRFTIRTNLGGVKVSWQVTGIRRDAFANAHRIPVEEAKPEDERGFYVHPEAFGQPDEMGLGWALRPENVRGRRENPL